VVARFFDHWWRQPLDFYAGIKGDITEFGSCLLEVNEFPGGQLAETQPNTPPSADPPVAEIA
jgi:hypothetical protein